MPYNNQLRNDYFSPDIYTMCPELVKFLAELEEPPPSEWQQSPINPWDIHPTPNWSIMLKYFPRTKSLYGGKWNRSGFPRTRPTIKKTPCRFPPGIQPPKLHASTPPGILESSFSARSQKRRALRLTEIGPCK